MALAAEKSKGLLNTIPDHHHDFICSVLRSENVPWCFGKDAAAIESFLQQSRHHGVQSLLFHTVREKAEWASWPSELRKELEMDAKSFVAQELLRTHQLQKLLQAFQALGIRFLLTKGEALAQTHYHMPGSRTRCDTDLFIDLRDIELARQAIENAGMTIVSPIYKSHQFTVRTAVDTEHGNDIDVHWRILNSPRFARSISFEEAYAESIPLARPVGSRTLCDKHALMLGCMHRLGNEKHDRNRLIWIYDIHLLACSLSADEWLAFVSFAVSRNVQASCLKGLRMSQVQFETPLSEAVISRLQKPENSQKYAYSNLALLADDWKCLPGLGAKTGLIYELFVASPEALMIKFDKSSRVWLPFLHLRQIFGGIVKRLSLH